MSGVTQKRLCIGLCLSMFFSKRLIEKKSCYIFFFYSEHLNVQEGSLPEMVWDWDRSLVRTSASTVTYWCSAGEECLTTSPPNSFSTQTEKEEGEHASLKSSAEQSTFTHSHDSIWNFLFSFDSRLMNSHIASAMRRIAKANADFCHNDGRLSCAIGLATWGN